MGVQTLDPETEINGLRQRIVELIDAIARARSHDEVQGLRMEAVMLVEQLNRLEGESPESEAS